MSTIISPQVSGSVGLPEFPVMPALECSPYRVASVRRPVAFALIAAAEQRSEHRIELPAIEPPFDGGAPLKVGV